MALEAGTLAAVDATGLVWTATVTATDGFAGTATVSVADGDYTDAAGNPGLGGTDTVTIDRSNADVSVSIGVEGPLTDADSSALVTFTFTEAPVGFAEGDIQLSAGLALEAGTLAAVDATGLVWTATVTATDGFAGTATVSVADGDLYGCGGQSRAGRYGHGDD